MLIDKFRVHANGISEAVVSDIALSISENELEDVKVINSLKKGSEAIAARIYRQSIITYREMNAVRHNFWIRWMMFRAAIPISAIVGYEVQDILYSGRRRGRQSPWSLEWHLTQAQKLVLWISHKIGKFTYADLGRSINRDYTSVRHHIQSAESLLQDKSSYLSLLLNDVFDKEEEFLPRLSRQNIF